MQYIHRRKIIPSLEEKMLLRGCEDCDFLVKYLYRCLKQANSECFAIRLLWSPWFPPNWLFFLLRRLLVVNF